MAHSDLFARVTAQIIAQIGAGAGDYQMLWHQQGLGQPTNAITGRPYAGINVLILWAAAQAADFASGRWATYRQWQASGAQVSKGAKATTVLLWKPVSANDRQNSDDADQAEARSRLLVRAYSLFNADQVTGFEPEAMPVLDPAARIAEAEAFFDRLPATIRFGGDEAYYEPRLDEIHMPSFSAFRSAEAYYSVLAHELTHWTGAQGRLSRDLTGRFGSAGYAMEELVAELGAAFLMAELDLSAEPRIDHAAYVQSWLDALRGDPKAVLTAASGAQRACEYLLAFGREIDARLHYSEAE